MAEIMPFITAILACGTVICPIVFGFVLWKMSRVFVTREQFDDFKSQRSMEYGEMKAKLKDIEADIRELLQR